MAANPIELSISLKLPITTQLDADLNGHWGGVDWSIWIGKILKNEKIKPGECFKPAVTSIHLTVIDYPQSIKVSYHSKSTVAPCLIIPINKHGTMPKVAVVNNAKEKIKQCYGDKHKIIIMLIDNKDLKSNISDDYEEHEDNVSEARQLAEKIDASFHCITIQEGLPVPYTLNQLHQDITRFALIYNGITPPDMDNKIDTASEPRNMDAIAKDNDSVIGNVQWLSEDNLHHMEKFATTLIDMVGDNHVIAIGQSPFWITRAAKMIKPELSCQHVAFSGSIFSTNDKFTQKNYYTCASELEEDKKQTYRNYLKSVKITPETIWENYKKGIKTFIFDLGVTGKGLASFLYILVQWSKDIDIDIKEALVFIFGSEHIHLYYSNDNGKNSEDCEIELSEYHLSIEGFGIPIQHDIFMALSVSNDDGPYCDRLIPSYKYSQWINLPDLASVPSEVILIADHLLKEYLIRKGKLQDKNGSNKEWENLYEYPVLSHEAPLKEKDSILSKAKNDSSFFTQISNQQKDILLVHRGVLGEYTPSNILSNLWYCTPWKATSSYRQLIIEARNKEEHKAENQFMSYAMKKK